MGFLEAEVGGYAATWLEKLGGGGAAPKPLPDRIGPYRVIDKLGGGGMGDVLLAERADGHFEHREAAVGCLRAGFDRRRTTSRTRDHLTLAILHDKSPG